MTILSWHTPSRLLRSLVFDFTVATALYQLGHLTLTVRFVSRYDLAPSTEFRCFVRRGEWVGACQRDTTHRYGFLLDAREQLDDALQDFFEAHVLETFALASCACLSSHPPPSSLLCVCEME